MLDTQVAWLAGLLEGEACFSCYRGTPCIALSMTDLDIVERAHSYMGGKMQKPYVPKGPNRKMVYGCRIHGQSAIDLMHQLLPFMGVRRSAKINEIFEAWSKSTYKPRWKGVGREPSTCHPEFGNYCKGLCKKCYMKMWHATHPEQDTRYYRQRKKFAESQDVE